MVLKLIIRIFALVGIVLTITYSALYLNPNYKNEYIVGIVPKLEKLKSIKKNKIVIIGGSNASFGIDSDLMEEQLGIAVVNMSLHGGLPIKFIIEQVKGYLNRGDILILSKEYGGLKDQYWNKMNGTELPKIITYDFSQIRSLLSDQELVQSTFSGIFKTVKHYINRHPIKKRKEENSVYSFKAFNGDNLSDEYLKGNYEKDIEEHKLPKLNKYSILLNELNSYKQYFDRKGIEFYLTPPVIIEGYYNSDSILPFWEYLSKTSGIPMLNKEKRYTYPRAYFFNSHYHTNYEGRKIRTLSLIDDIRNKRLIVHTK